MIEIKLTTKQADQLQAFVTDHRNACYMHLYDEEDVREGWEPYDLYDGCDVCDTREQLMATFDWLKSQGLVDVFVE